MNITKYKIGALALVAMGSIALATPAFAQTSPTAQTNQNNGPQGRGQGGMMGMMHGGMGAGMGTMKPAVFGTVTSVDGTTLVVSGKSGFGPNIATTTYTVDASNATVRKDNATSTVSAIAVGDSVMVQGTISNTSVTATMIRDGLWEHMSREQNGGRMASSTRAFGGGMSGMTGNGQPVIGGTVSAINGSNLTVTNKSNVTYTVDASNAKITQGQNTITVATIKTGDTVFVQGTVNGTSVTASSIIDGVARGNGGTNGAPASGTPSGNGSGQKPAPHEGGGFFGSIGQFFKNIFGF